MKIAFFVNGFPIASETFILNQIAGMAARGHALDIYALCRPTATEERTIRFGAGDSLLPRVCYLGAPDAALARLTAAAGIVARTAWRAPRLCGRALNVFRYRRDALTLRLLCASLPFLRHGPRRYDVIHCQFGPLGRLAMRLRQIGALRGTLVTAFRGYDATMHLRRYPHAYDELFHRGDLFLPVSGELRRVLIAYGAPADKTEVHHSGIDCRYFDFQLRTRGANEPTRAITVARLVEKKGIEFAIRAAARLIHSGRALSYDIVGDGELRAALERLIAALNMGGHIRVLGWRRHDEVAALLRRAHVLLAPSVTAANGDQEGIANALKEAMATGLPVLATDHGGTAELVDHGVSGFLVPERDVEALADRLGYLVDHPERWADIGRAGRAKVEAAFDLERLNNQLERLYQRLVNGVDTARASVPWTACAADKV